MINKKYETLTNKRRALNDEIKFLKPGSDEYNSIAKQIENTSKQIFNTPPFQKNYQPTRI